MKTPSPAAITRSREPAHSGGDSSPSALDWARESGEADRVMRELDVYLRHRRRRRQRATATGVALVALGLLAWPALRPRVNPSAAPDLVATSAVVVRPETRQLPDGTRVELNAGAELEVDFSGPLRRVALRRGEAHFQVAKDAQRTFVVEAGGVAVRAVGTAFSVGMASGTIEVLVTEGHVAVESPARGQPMTAVSAVPAAGAAPEAVPVVGAGRRIRVEVGPRAEGTTGPQVAAISNEEIDRQLAWRVPRLEFAGTALAQALPLFNAHGRVRLVLSDPALGRLQLSGVLRADDTESLLRLLEGEFALVGERRGDELVLRRR